LRLKKLTNKFELSKNYENEQKMVLSSIISRLNRVGDFFDVIIKLEKFIIEEVRDEYTELTNVRADKDKIVMNDSLFDYTNKHFLPAVDNLNNKIELSVQSWNYVEREYTTGKIYGFVSAIKNFYKELNMLEGQDDENDLHPSSTTEAIKDLINDFDRFKIYKAIMSENIINRIEILLSMQVDILESNSESKKLTLDDL